MTPTQVDILLVEDSDLDFEMTSRAIRELSPAVNVVRAKKCGTAKEALAKSACALMILDIDLCSCNGLDFLEGLAASASALSPVVIFTSSSHPGDRQRALQIGARDFVTKPFGSHEFLSTVRAMVLPYLASPPC